MGASAEGVGRPLARGSGSCPAGAVAWSTCFSGSLETSVAGAQGRRRLGSSCQIPTTDEAGGTATPAGGPGRLQPSLRLQDARRYASRELRASHSHLHTDKSPGNVDAQDNSTLA